MLWLVVMQYPVISVNFKAYAQATGQNAVALALTISKVAAITKRTIISIPQIADLSQVSKINPSFSQHVDNVQYGARTGWILPESAKAAGAMGTLLNHSEHRLTIDEIKAGVERAHSAGLQACVCAPDEGIARQAAEFNPEQIAVEPPELIGSGIPVSKAKPEAVSKSVENVKSINPKVRVLCGAGISTGSDVKKALELGAEGVLVASAIVCAKNPYDILLDMAKNLEAK